MPARHGGLQNIAKKQAASLNVTQVTVSRIERRGNEEVYEEAEWKLLKEILTKRRWKHADHNHLTAVKTTHGARIAEIIQEATDLTTGPMKNNKE